MLTIILQQLITVGINFLDNLIIGGFGETQIAAAAFGNQLTIFTRKYTAPKNASEPDFDSRSSKTVPFSPAAGLQWASM